jgi:hypothetical protein
MALEASAICVIFTPPHEPPPQKYIVALCPYCREELKDGGWTVRVLRPSPGSDCGICDHPYEVPEGDPERAPMEEEL